MNGETLLGLMDVHDARNLATEFADRGAAVRLVGLGAPKHG
jgi:hypothetical protein